jgi:hypothetical protein
MAVHGDPNMEPCNEPLVTHLGEGDLDEADAGHAP